MAPAVADEALGRPRPRWSLDVVADALWRGGRFRVLCIDDFTREALALGADTSMGGHRMARERDAVIARRAASP